jgi:hypothetical protein
MPERWRFDAPQEREDAGWARRMGEVPDLLVTAQYSLRALAKGEGPAASVEARQMIGAACDLLDVALANVLEVTQNLPDLATLKGRVASAGPIAISRQRLLDDGTASRQ